MGVITINMNKEVSQEESGLEKLKDLRKILYY